MIRIRSILLALLLFPVLVWSQKDSVPYFPDQPLPTFAAVPRRKFNQKDAAMMVMRQTAIYTQFTNPGDTAVTNRFRFIDLNSDGAPDAVYSARPAKGKPFHTWCAVMRDMKYVLVVDEPGQVTDWDSLNGTLHFTLRQYGEPGELYLNRLTRIAVNARTGERTLLWEMSWYGDQVPAQKITPPLIRETAVSAYVRHTPIVKDDPLTDYNLDKKMDGKGNLLGVLPQGTRVYLLSAEKTGDGDFVFILARTKGIAPGHALYGIEGKPAWIAGWVLAEQLRDF